PTRRSSDLYDLPPRQADTQRAHARTANRERAEGLSAADRPASDPPVEEVVVDDLLIPRANPACADIDTLVAELPVGDANELRTGGCVRLQASVSDQSPEDDGGGQQP